MEPTVSVVVPTYNHAHYLPFALRSVQAQTCREWEAIVVDDGSTDSPAAVVEQLADPKIRCLRQANQGVSAARNTGIRAARGRYLAFLDADDEWEPEFLKRGAEALDADGTLAGVYTYYRFIDQGGRLLPQMAGQSVPRAALRGRLLEGGFFPPHAVLVRAAVVREVGLFDTRLSGLADWDLWLRIAERHEMEAIPEFLARYRVNPGSMSTNAAAMHLDVQRVLARLFGPPEGGPQTWPADKRRAYGFAYRVSALNYLEQGRADEARSFLGLAAGAWPALLGRLDTFYELACGDQPKGYRGQAAALDIEGNGARLLKWLDRLFAARDPALAGLRRAAYGNAHLALAMLSDQAGRWPAARGHLLAAMRANPRLAASYPVLRRMIKLCAGARQQTVGAR